MIYMILGIVAAACIVVYACLCASARAEGGGQ
jgi:hypothetical protein